MLDSPSLRGTTLARVLALALTLAALSCGGDPSRPGDPNLPVFDPVSPLSLSEVSSLSQMVSATDPNGDPISLSLSAPSSFATLADSGDGTGNLVLTPALGDAGEYLLGVRASDGSGSVVLDIAIEVTAVTPVPGGLFYEAPSFCLTGAQTGKTITLFNRDGARSLIFHPIRLVPGADALNQRQVLDPATILDIPWTWTPAGPYPATDTLVALTNDPDWPVVVIPMRREDPAGFTDFIPPDPPNLAVPDDGAVYTLVFVNPGWEVEIPLVWSFVDDCSGVDHYQLQIATDPAFTSIVLDVPVPDSVSGVVAENGDQGVAYWRVFAVDSRGLQGPPSAVRSWTVVGGP